MTTSTGEQVGAVVDATVENTQANAQAEIDAARVRADENAAAARQIADAAMQTELGGRISALQQENDTWRGATDQRLAELQEINRQQAAKLEEATGLFASIRGILTTPQAPSPERTQQQQASPAAPVTDQTAAGSTGTGPSGSHAAVQAETQAPAPPRKRHFL